MLITATQLLYEITIKTQFEKSSEKDYRSQAYCFHC